MGISFISDLMGKIEAKDITEREAARVLMRLSFNKGNKGLIEDLLVLLCNEVYPPRLLMALVRATYSSNNLYTNWAAAVSYGKEHHPDLFVGLNT